MPLKAYLKISRVCARRCMLHRERRKPQPLAVCRYGRDIPHHEAEGETGPGPGARIPAGLTTNPSTNFPSCSVSKKVSNWSRKVTCWRTPAPFAFIRRISFPNACWFGTSCYRISSSGRSGSQSGQRKQKLHEILTEGSDDDKCFALGWMHDQSTWLTLPTAERYFA